MSTICSLLRAVEKMALFWVFILFSLTAVSSYICRAIKEPTEFNFIFRVKLEGGLEVILMSLSLNEYEKLFSGGLYCMFGDLWGCDCPQFSFRALPE